MSASPALTKIVFFDVVAERAEAHTKQFGRLHLDPAGTLERFGNIAALDLFDVCFEVEPGLGQGFYRSADRPWRRVAANVLRQALGENRGRGLQGDRALDDILELAD